MWFEGRAREEEGGREGGEGERGKGGGREGAGRDVVRVYSAASATSLGEGNTGHTPDPPQQNPTRYAHQLAFTCLLSCSNQPQTSLVCASMKV